MRRLEPAEPGRTWSRPAAMLAASLVLVAFLPEVGDGSARAGEAAVSDIAVAGETPSRPLAIQAMTTVGADGAGYFSDPYPVRLAPSSGMRTQVFSGTTKAIMSCAYPLSAGCFSWTPASINAGALRTEIAAAGASITNFQNLDVFQDDAGGWHAVLAIGVHNPAHPRYWTVLVHAHPTTFA